MTAWRGEFGAETYHWQAEDVFQRRVREQRHECDLNDFLLTVCVRRKQWRGMLREMVCPVVLPKSIKLVTRAVVGVEEEVENDRVQSQFQW